MPTPFNPKQIEVARKRRFMLLCGSGAGLIILGILVPKMLPGAAITPLDSKPPSQGSTKALPPASEKPALPVRGAATGKEVTTKTLPNVDSPGLGAILTRLVGGTIVVLILCAATAFGVGRWLKGKNPTAPAGPMKVVASLSLNTRCSLFLVQVGDQHLVAGIDATGLRSIVHLPGGIEEQDDDETTPALAEAAQRPELPTAAFSTRAPVAHAVPERSTRLST